MSTDYKSIFFGTSRFSVIVFDELRKQNIVPKLLVTQPDRPQGRKLQITPPPAKVWATEQNIPVCQPENLQTIQNICPQISDADVYIVASYGTILPAWLLSLPRRGVLNVHPSLLPKYRGASPIQSAILADDRETGVTIIALDRKMDHGPIVAQQKKETPMWPPTATELEETLARAGGKLLADVLPQWLTGEISPREQEHDKATFTKKIVKEDGKLDLSADPYQNFLKIQALEPWPGTFFFTNRNGRKIRIKIIAASYKNRTLSITKVIPEGGREMPYEDFNGNLT
ncbi:MAG: methionyl-tRNA formyltransferase [Parcubacteria group bacterium Gr01-1014_48]|nr:MAG: methionyl-tRNA formyltransferase [Parcubacteria group bacterium Greene0416_14]TSC73321.1 MAG: methionyl-tRNA formyltransferase [Parcubacteria group bacterium Gr01-1014_48]TSC99948.1 MAG: methionyl-tRNA formyltransferase [Parcubacteria group bacterium Greene1014_15]TSD07414.1 MAG: methionyl-tRNA formyltransferase [Parcubacteria group bacterium Greene0714_4]